MSRVTMFVANDVTRDSRVLREAAALAAAGHAVRVIGRQPRGVEGVSREAREGFEIMLVPYPDDWRSRGAVGVAETVLRRASLPMPILKPAALRNSVRRQSGRVFSGLARALPPLQQRIGLRRHLRRGRAALATVRESPPPPTPPLPPAAAATAAAVRRQQRSTTKNVSNSTSLWLRHWRYGVLAWARTAAAAAPPADIWHGHDLTALPAALQARRLHGGRVVYDSHELFLESAAHAERPAWARWLLATLERRWANRAAAVIAVNDAIGTELTRRYGLRRVVVVDNCPPRWQPPPDRIDHLRAATGIPASAPIALYHGRFAAHRGLEQLADALLEPGLEHVHAVYLGYGPGQALIETFMAEPRFGGRIHLVPAVEPKVLLDWLAPADVEVMAIQPSTLNHRLATGNKLFEALAVGVPVVASDHPGKRLVVQGIGDGPLGELCDPTDVRDVARAMRAVLSLPDDERAALRARCLRAANERWNWEVESAKLVELYAELGRRRPAAG